MTRSEKTRIAARILSRLTRYSDESELAEFRPYEYPAVRWLFLTSQIQEYDYRGSKENGTVYRHNYR